MPTTDTTVGRLQLAHPDLGHDGGTGLHTKVRNAWTKLGDNINGRFFTVDALADAASQDFEHNFKCLFDELQVLLYQRDTGTGELTRINAASSPAIGDFGIVAKVGSETTQVTVTNNTGGPEDLAVIVIQNGGGSSGGGGGGGSLNWDEPPGISPLKDSENGQVVYLFEAGSANKLVAFVKVPQSHAPGAQLSMRMALYSPATANTIRLEALSTLIRLATDAMDSTTNQHTSTNTALTNSAPANKYREDVLDLTDGSGQVNSVTVQPGDMLKVELTRDATDTDTSDIRFVPNGTEVS